MVLVIPAYVYDWKPIREIVIYGELLAISAILMCLLSSLVDIGRPDRFWHLIPVIGHLNFPRSILAWDVLVLNIYFLINFSVATHILYRAFHGKHYAKRLVVPLVLLSVPMAVGHPYGHGVPVQRPGGAAVLEFVDSGAAVPRVGILLGPAILLSCCSCCAGSPVRDPGRGDLEDRRADGLRDVPQPVPARRGGVQGILLEHRAPAVHALLVSRDRRPPHAGAVRVVRGGAERRGVRPVHRPGTRRN